jgi:hypothetical protein
MTIGYPTQALGHRIEIAPGADLTANPSTYSWTDITSDWYQRDGISHKRGCEDEQGAGSSELKFSLRNNDGDYSTNNPESDLCTYWQPGLPFRHSIDLRDGTGWRQRCVQFMENSEDTWPAGTSMLCVSKVEACGLFQRLGVGNVVKSPIHQMILNGNPTACWPLTDGELSSSALALDSGTSAMRTIVPVKWAQVDGPIGAPSKFCAPIGATGIPALEAPVSGDTGASWTVGLLFKAEFVDSSKDGAVYLASWDTNGLTNRWFIWAGRYSGVPEMHVMTYDSDGLWPIKIDVTDADVFDGGWHLVHVVALQTGGTLSCVFYLDGAAIGSQDETTTAGRITWIRAWRASDVLFSTVGIGYLTAHSGEADIDNIVSAMGGHSGEMAHERWGRVCSENGIPYELYGSPTVSEVMGPQPVARVLDILRDIEKTDQGIADDSQGIAWYRTYGSLCTVEPSLTIDGDQRQIALPFSAKRDTQKLVNRVVANRPDGGSVTVENAASIAAVGTFEATVESNVATNDDLLRHAQFRLSQGGVADARYPNINVDLLVAPTLAADWCDLALGDRMQIVNPPRQHRKGAIDQQIRGWTETYAGNRRGWAVSHNGAPYFPIYNALIVDSDNDVVDADYSTLDAIADEVDPGDMQSISVATSQGPAWSTDAGDYPRDGSLGGERVTIASVSGASSPQISVVTRGVDGVRKEWPIGTPIFVWHAGVVSLYGW